MMSTLNDVAKTAGVSPVTVSRVINTPSLVRDETLDRVKKAIETQSLNFVVE